MANKKKLILIDGNAIIHRAFHALPPLTDKNGEVVNAVYGFSSTLLAVLDKFNPDYVVASFDLKGATFRHEKFEAYKATRQKSSDELYRQIPKVKEVVKAFNIPIFEKEGYEADDIIGTISRNPILEENNIETIIVTGDLDALQLVNENVKVYTMSRGISKAVLYDEDSVKERYGFKPEQLKDYKGLRGDASDNIPGVRGIGEKTATNLLQKYGTLEKVYENLDEVKGAVNKKLEEGKEDALISKELGTIFTEVEIDFKLGKCVMKDFDRNKVIDLFRKFRFYSLIKRLPGYEEEEKKKEKPKEISFEKISPEDLDDFLEKLKRQSEFALFLHSFNNTNGVAFSWEKGRAYYVSLEESILEKIKPFLENKKQKKIVYDAKELYKFFKNKNLDIANNFFDIMIGAYLLRPGSKVEFEKLVLEYLGIELEDKKGKQMKLGEMEGEEEVKSICEKAGYVLTLGNLFLEKIRGVSKLQKEKYNIEYILNEIENPLVKILAEMELAGIKINKKVFSKTSEKIGEKIIQLEKEIYKLAGKEFNINSPGQLSKILFEDLGLPVDEIKKTQKSYSTAASELIKLKDKHSIIGKIENYRELFKLKTTYLDSLPELTDENDKLHTNFKQTVTATGRLSSVEPNLQNIPIRTKLGKSIRKAFEAEKGNVLISADYSQIDLRVMAHMSEDPNMIDAFQKGKDIHQATAAIVNKVSLEDVTKKMRYKAKALNFGMIYGMSVFGFSQSAGIDRDEAKEFMSNYMQKFSKVAEFIDKTKKFAKENEYVETELGRRRYLPEINSSNFQVANSGERMALNMPIQGLAADIMKLAMIAVADIISEFNSNDSNKDAVNMILQIHDEIILEVREDLADEVSKKVKKTMENVYNLKVPLVVDIEIGKNWGEI